LTVLTPECALYEKIVVLSLFLTLHGELHPRVRILGKHSDCVRVYIVNTGAQIWRDGFGICTPEEWRSMLT
jgi:hypothetical protein